MEFFKNILEKLDELGTDKEVVINFFVVFSRFEYALKSAGYLQNGPNAKPDWCEFASDIMTDFDRVEDETVLEAADWLKQHPPKKQVTNNNGLEFSDRNDATAHGSVLLTRLITTIRNNLFHGGKYSTDSKFVDSARDIHLLENSLIVLRGFLQVAKGSECQKLVNVEESFFL
jgi:hypothetical protein